jgi:hypothetical protein
MKKLMYCAMMISSLLAISPALGKAASMDSTELLSPPNLSNSDLMHLLHIVKKEFGWSMNQTRDLYDAGLVTITPMPQIGDDVFMLGYDGWCILAALEDRL